MARHPLWRTCHQDRIGQRVTPNYGGFLHFTPSVAHCVRQRWSLAVPSRNLAP